MGENGKWAARTCTRHPGGHNLAKLIQAPSNETILPERARSGDLTRQDTARPDRTMPHGSKWKFIIWLSINAILFLVMIVTPIFFSIVGDVGSITTKEYNIHFNNVLCVRSLCGNLQLKYQINHSSKDRIVEFSSHQVVIKDLKDPKHVLAFGIIYQNVQVFMYTCVM